MLEASDEPIETIALEVGYQDPGYFSRLFRRKVALKPAQYRRRFRSLTLQVQGTSDATVNVRKQVGTESTRSNATASRASRG
jgi:methylphosphotriester-DNA--protein-cysteine methyltransferase